MKNDEIKEILDYLKRSDKNKFGFEKGKLIDYEETQLLLDYITNLQEKYDEANNAINWWSNKAKELQQENEYLKMNSPEQNIEHFRIINENKRKIDNLREQNKQLKSILDEMGVNPNEVLDYKSRCEKADEYINCNKQKTICAYGDNEDDDFEICLWEEDIDNLLNILQNGSDSQC